MTLPLLHTLAAVDAAAEGGPPILEALGWEAGDVALALAHAEDGGLIAGHDAPRVTEAGLRYAYDALRPLAVLWANAEALEIACPRPAPTEAGPEEGAA